MKTYEKCSWSENGLELRSQDRAGPSSTSSSSSTSSGDGDVGAFGEIDGKIGSSGVSSPRRLERLANGAAHRNRSKPPLLDVQLKLFPNAAPVPQFQ